MPTNKEMIRKDNNDQVFRTEEEKNYAILNKERMSIKRSLFCLNNKH